MKILFVLTYYRPHWTGLTQYAARLAEGLTQKGNQIEVLCSQHNRKLPRFEEINGVKVSRLPFQFHFLRSVVALSFPFEFIRRARRNEVVLVFLPLQEVVFVSLVCRVLRKKIFLVHNGDLVLPESGGFFNRLVEKIYEVTTSFSIKLSNGIVIHTKDYARNSEQLSRHRNKWRVILPPFIFPKISRPERTEFIKRNKLENKKLIGFAGRFVEEKGIDYLLRAIPLVIQKVPQAHFVFAGEHKVKYESFWTKIKPLIKKSRKDITLLGLLDSRREIFVFYKALDVFVIPSRTDCFPFAQVEAVLSRIPSVCTNIPGARWVVKTTQMGLLVAPKNPKALAEGIIKVLRDKKKYLKPQKEIEKIFNFEKALKQYEILFGG